MASTCHLPRIAGNRAHLRRLRHQSRSAGGTQLRWTRPESCEKAVPLLRARRAPTGPPLHGAKIARPKICRVKYDTEGDAHASLETHCRCSRCPGGYRRSLALGEKKSGIGTGSDDGVRTDYNDSAGGDSAPSNSDPASDGQFAACRGESRSVHPIPRDSGPGIGKQTDAYPRSRSTRGHRKVPRLP